MYCHMHMRRNSHTQSYEALGAYKPPLTLRIVRHHWNLYCILL